MADDNLEMLQELLNMAEEEETAPKEQPQVTQQRRPTRGAHPQEPKSLRSQLDAAPKTLGAGKSCEVNDPRLQDLPAELPAGASVPYCYLVLQHSSQQAQLPSLAARPASWRQQAPAKSSPWTLPSKLLASRLEHLRNFLGCGCGSYASYAWAEEPT